MVGEFLRCAQVVEVVVVDLIRFDLCEWAEGVGFVEVELLLVFALFVEAELD